MAKCVFISQPDTDKAACERALENARVQIKRKLRANTYEVLNAELKADDGPAQLRETLDMILKADLVIFANGWNKSRRCNVEHAICEEYGISYIEV